ncbi:RluA family pseudouridine synthase [Rapidithrix thailandica]|uniref:RluA family pseudouridine synthase n=1 Tax=Rapidithrix thailandica TaxID=413964 RepID=A0AAW9RRU0_9BACT
MRSLENHIVPPGILPQRLSDYVQGLFERLPSHQGIKKAIKRGELLVDGQVSSTGHWVQAGQCIELVEREDRLGKIYELPLHVVYEDDALAVINKPGGLRISGNQFRTLENALRFNLKPSSAYDALLQPRPVHRLDSPTKGLVLIAKTTQALHYLSHQFARKTIHKQYKAIVAGKVEGSGRIAQMIEGKEAITEYTALSHTPSLQHQWLTLVELSPLTGRTHQLRIHLSHLGHPIIGDSLYGPETMQHKGLFLCAVALHFTHPVTGEPLRISINPPEKFQSFPAREQRRWEKYP